MSFTKVFSSSNILSKSHLVLFTQLTENEVRKEVDFGSIIDGFAFINTK